jgi:hypothetical protein
MQAAASFKITVCGIEELTEHGEARVSHVVSILDPTWPVPSALDIYRECERLELCFDDVIARVPDKLSPGPPPFGYRFLGNFWEASRPNIQSD